MISFEKVFKDRTCYLSLLLDQFIRNKLSTPLPNKGTKSACSPRPTGRRGPQLEPMLKQNLNFLRYEQNFWYSGTFTILDKNLYKTFQTQMIATQRILNYIGISELAIR